ncbi:SIR2-like domain-containing protein [Salipiger thiooxidans]|uniref:SIR2-like domain-containing protein n=1 Tax=Salipiger thiooxidans TaxID=282683 RepID=A0A1G7HPX3_9RHOB|nr:nitrogen fixation protein NifZ [Salipiger thiooxidans]SDF02503.1 SIR2-like domain-containing protein [Salipiger thiooxidans]
MSTDDREIEVYRDPAYMPGDKVISNKNIKNDGTMAGKEICETVVRKGGVGYVRDIGVFLQQFYIYAVDFVDRASIVGMREREFALAAAFANPVHDWLARVRPPMVADTWYDDGLLRAFERVKDWGLVQGGSRNGEWIDIFTRAYDCAGTEVGEASADWKTLLHKPHGLARPGASFLISDSDYVEGLTEIDIQRPIPEEVQRRCTGRPLLFLGCRCDDQMLRTFARQIGKRSAEGHVAVMPGPLTRMEARFLDELGITWLDLAVAALSEMLTVPEG